MAARRKRKKDPTKEDYNAEYEVNLSKVYNDPLGAEAERFLALSQVENVEQVVSPKCSDCCDTGIKPVVVFGLDADRTYLNVCKCEAGAHVLH